MKTYCINLESRPDRWKRVQVEALKIRQIPIRFDAIKCDIGHDGCKASHMKLLSEVKEEIFMVIEDDFKISCKNAFTTLMMAFRDLPDNWDMLYLGATLTKKIYRCSDNLYRLQGGSATQGIIYNNQNGVVDYILKNHNRNRFSAFLRDDVQENFNCYLTNPMIATQAPGFSDLMNKRTSGRAMRRAYKKYTR